jgi:hypothetical protein
VRLCRAFPLTSVSPISPPVNCHLRFALICAVLPALGWSASAPAPAASVPPSAPAPAAEKADVPPPNKAPGKKGKAAGKQAANGPDASAKKAAPAPAPTPPHADLPFPGLATSARSRAVAPPAEGESVVFIGNGLAERDVYYSRMETELQLRFPDRKLIVRNMGRPGDTPGFRPHPARVSQWAFPGAERYRPEFKSHNGKGFFPTPDQWLTHLKADTIVAFFGYNESFDGPERVGNFEAELDAWVRHSLGFAYNGTSAPRIVLVSPIAFENLSATRDLPNGAKENANLKLYAAAVQRVAVRHALTFIDFFQASLDRYGKSPRSFTLNGFAPTEAGYEQLGQILADGLYGATGRKSEADAALVNAAVKEKDWLWNNDYNLVNGVHTHGQRYTPYGPQNYPDEIKKTREMMALRDTLIHEVASGRKRDLVVDDSRTHALPPVPTNFKPGGAMGTGAYQPGTDAARDLKSCSRRSGSSPT